MPGLNKGSSIGNFNGKSVSVVSNPVKHVQEALEEIGMARAGFRSIDKRKLESSKRSAEVGKDLAEEYLKSRDPHGVDRAEYLQDLNVLLKEYEDADLDENQVEENIARYLDSKGISEPYEQYAMLVAYRSACSSGEIEPSDYKDYQIEKILNSSYSEDGRAIRAGFNVSPSADGFLQVSSEGLLVGMYVDTVLDVTSLCDLHKKLSKHAAGDKYVEYIKFLIDAVGRDFNALVSSTDLATLKSSLSSLKSLQILQTIRGRCGDIANRLAPVLHEGVDASEIYSELLLLLESSYPLASNVIKSYKKIVLDEPQYNVWIHNEMYGAFQSVPHHVFEDLSSRAVLIEALDDAMEQVVELEELEEK